MSDTQHDDQLPEFMREAFSVILEKRRPKIQEKDFIRYFLEGFAGKIEKVPLERWLDVAGNAMNEVEVCNGDEVLFIVPPLMGPVNIAPIPGQAFAVAEIIAKAQKLNYIHPNQGKAYMQEMLGSRIGHTKSDLGYIHQWNAIFQRYNLPTIPIEGSPSESNNKDKEPPAPPIETYEDF